MFSQWKRRLGSLSREESGQDLIEYALLAAFVAVAVAAFLPPTVAPAISAIFSKVVGYMSLV
jgi:Flp pilus assembly pilin Flp